MKKIINYYPTLNDEIREKVFTKTVFSFSYKKNKDEECEIKHDESIGNNISLVTKKTDWSHSEYDLYMQMKMDVENGELLYGKNGIAPKDSKINLAYEFYSQKSRTREVIVTKESLDDDGEGYTYTVNYTFKKNKYINDVEINTIIFLKESAEKVEKDCNFLNNEEGVILGEVDHRRLFLIGAGSLFPIYLEAIDNNRLWTFDIDYEDPEIDKFADCSRLVFNISHKDYEMLDPKSKKYCDRLVLEIISTSLFMSFTKLKDEGYLERISSSYEDGSIMSLISYYKDTLGFDFSSSQSIFDSLHNYVGKEYSNAL